MTGPSDNPHSLPLFREEALHHHAQRLHGSVQIYTPMSWHIIGALLLILLVAGGIFLSLASYPRTQTASGVIALDKGVAHIAASRGGTIAQVSVAEGQTVRRGQELAQIRIDEQPIANLAAQDGAGSPGPAAGSRGYRLIAPTDGVVTALRARAGASADPAQSLMTIIPQSSTPQVELFVPSEAVGFIAAGDEVKLSLDAYPTLGSGTLPSRVIGVAQFPTTRPGGEDLRPVHIVTASLPRPWVDVGGRKRAILPGMTLSGRIVIERRTLLEWLFEPVFAADGH